MKTQLEKSYQIKTNVLGPDAEAGESKELRFLDCVLSCRDWGIGWEADPRHADLVIQHLGLEGCRPVVTPVVKEEPKKVVDDAKSTERQGTRTDEPTQGQLTNHEDATKQAPKAKLREISEVFENEGWSRNQLGGFVKRCSSATSIDIPRGCEKGLRVARDAKIGELIDELAF